MEQVEFGIVASIVPVEIEENNINDVGKAFIVTNDAEYIAYIKRMPVRLLYVECVCAIIGRYFDLPIPKPLMARVTNENFSDIPVGSYELVFGSIDLKHPSFRRYISRKLPDEIVNKNFSKLKSFDKIADIGIFDEFIANKDRHPGNILFDGLDFYFIDHDQAMPEGLKPCDAAAANLMVEVVYGDRSDHDKLKLIQFVRSKIEAYNKLLFNTLSDKINLTYMDGFSIEEATSIIDFLTERTVFLPKLFENRLCIQQQQQELI